MMEVFYLVFSDTVGFPGGSVVKNPSASAGDVGSIPVSGRSPGGGNGNPLQYSCLEKLHGQRSLVGYSPWGRTRLGTNTNKHNRYGSHQPLLLARHLKCDFYKWRAESLCLFGVNRFLFEHSCRYINALPALRLQLLKLHSCLQRSCALFWRPPSVFADTHALVSLLQNLNKANYHLPIMVTDSGRPPMTNVTELRVHVCSCKNSKVDCNAAGAPRLSAAAVLLLSLLSLARKLTKLQCVHSGKT